MTIHNPLDASILPAATQRTAFEQRDSEVKNDAQKDKKRDACKLQGFVEVDSGLRDLKTDALLVRVDELPHDGADQGQAESKTHSAQEDR